jgi:capsular exopolysaccharide synthesis family protein
MLALTKAPQFDESSEGGLDLGQVIAAIRRKAFLIAGITTVVAALAAFKATTEDPLYKGQFEILIEPETIETKVISSTNPNTLSSQEESITTQEDAIKLKILKSPEVMEPIVKQLQTRYPRMTYGSLYSNLNLKSEGQTTKVLTVSFQDKSSELVKSVLDLVSQTYLDYSLNTRQTGIRRGIKFVESQLLPLRERVVIQQERLQKIRQENNLVDPQIKGQQLSQSIASFGQEQLENQIQLNEARSMYASLQKELLQQGAESAALSVLSNNTRYQNLLNQLLAIDTQMAQDSVLLLEASSEIQTLQQQRQNLLPLIRREGQRVAREMATRIQELETRSQILDRTLISLNQQVKQLSFVIRQYNEVQRELDIATENLNQFLSQREALRIDAAQKEIPWRLLVPPNEPKPNSVSLKQNLALGTILGLLLGLGTALVLDKLGNLLHTSKDIKDVTHLPVLGVIPWEKELEKLTDNLAFFTASESPQNGNYSNGRKPKIPFSPGFLEAFRFLYTNIRFLSSDPPIQSLVISSAAFADGKSTISLYLAQAAAAMGQRVLLVDTDLRHPNLHDRLNLNNEKGLSDFLATKATDFNEAIQRSLLEENLFVLTAGSMSPDPTRLLASAKMQDLMEKLEAIFDLVIYKAPPLVGFADPYLLANHTDGVLLVATLGKLKRSALAKTLDELRTSGTPVLGLAINGAQDTPSSNFSKLRDRQVS